MQLEFKRDDGTPMKTATVKAGGAETETLPLFTNKDTITGEVSLTRSARGALAAPLNACTVAHIVIFVIGAGQNIAIANAQVKVANIPGKKLEHQGIKVQLIGQIELATERGHPHDFVNLGENPLQRVLVPSTRWK